MKHKQQGVALLLVLLLLAAISLMAINSSENIRLLTSRTQNSSLMEQAYWYALGGEALTHELLARDRDSERTDNQQDWATKGAVFPIDGGSLQGEIIDQNTCFNLNALQHGDALDGDPELPHKVFESLLKSLDQPEYRIEMLRQRVKDWIDADSENTGFQGMEFGYSSVAGLAYDAPNTPMSDPSEIHLLNIEEMDDMQALWPLLCTLPNDNLEINVNTLTTEFAPMLVGLTLGKLNLEEARSLIQRRPEQGFTSLDDFWEETGLEEISAEMKSIAVMKSHFFRSDIQVNYYGAIYFHRAWVIDDGTKIYTYARQYGEFL